MGLYQPREGYISPGLLKNRWAYEGDKVSGGSARTLNLHKFAMWKDPQVYVYLVWRDSTGRIPSCDNCSSRDRCHFNRHQRSGADLFTAKNNIERLTTSLEVVINWFHAARMIAEWCTKLINGVSCKGIYLISFQIDAKVLFSVPIWR